VARGVLASGHPEVSAAGACLLREGGNAFDAAVAAGFAASLAEPMFTSLGGGGFLLARREGDAGHEQLAPPEQGVRSGPELECAGAGAILFDFFVDTPGRELADAARQPHFVPMTVDFGASDQVFNIGHGSVAVPGTLAGLLHVHRRLGSRPLESVLAPAIALARDGVVVTDHQAYVIGLLRPINTLGEAGAALYTIGGRDPSPGDRLFNPDLARFLESLLDGGDLYSGPIATRIAGDMARGGGLVSEADLAAYRVEEREPLEVAYRDHRLLTNPPPAFGGTLVALALSLHAEEDLGALGWGSVRHLDAIARVMREVDSIRDGGALAGDGLSMNAVEAIVHRRRASRGTTHISVTDSEGNAASLTLSNGEGSGYVVPGTGIMLNNMLGEEDIHPDGFHRDPPGERVASMMSPSILLEQGSLRLVLGSGGSKRIRTALTQVLSDVVDFEMAVEEAVVAPRLHWDGERLHLEPGFDPGVVAELGSRWPLNLWNETSLYFGGVHAVDAAGRAAGDPRRAGAALRVE
jgi:gamma-glutamyltranspeptidase/glutathione hydrolase